MDNERLVESYGRKLPSCNCILSSFKPPNPLGTAEFQTGHSELVSESLWGFDYIYKQV
jgi:hypothetical protein